MPDTSTEVVVAGHICLDILPGFGEETRGSEILVPGSLVNIGPARLAVGGAVANTGLALHQLGTSTRLMGKVGDDLFGHAILDIVRQHGDELVRGMLMMEHEQSSYSIILNPPGLDRLIFHHPGANDTFRADEIVPAQVRGARLFHFGYPPLMRVIYADGGEAFATLLQAIKATGATTSLDMALPDPDSEAGRVDWLAWLAHVLPHVDIFLPSIDEILYMLGLGDKARGQQLTGPQISAVGAQLLQMGAAVVALKLGPHGLYLRSTDHEARLREMGAGAPRDLQAWRARELLTSCFQVEVAGTTGAGDCTIAGFLGATVRGLSPEETLTCAVAVGACSVEQADATSGVPTWLAMQKRLQAGWQRHSTLLSLPGWRYDAQAGIWHAA